MVAVEIYPTVRRFVFVEGKSRRETAPIFGLNRETIAKMCRYTARPAMYVTRPRSVRSSGGWFRSSTRVGRPGIR